MTICDRCGEEIVGPAHVNPIQVLENLCGYCYREVKGEIDIEDRKRKRGIYIKILKNNKLWTNYPVLSLIRKGDAVEHGVLLADATPVIYIENGHSIGQCKKDICKFVTRYMTPVKYSDFDSIIDDNWEVSTADIKVIGGKALVS